MLDSLQDNRAAPMLLQQFQLLPRMRSTAKDIFCPFTRSKEDIVFDLLLVLFAEFATKYRVRETCLIANAG